MVYSQDIDQQVHYIDEDVFEMEDAEIEGLKCFLCVACSGTEYYCLCPCWNT